MMEGTAKADDLASMVSEMTNLKLTDPSIPTNATEKSPEKKETGATSMLCPLAAAILQDDESPRVEKEEEEIEEDETPQTKFSTTLREVSGDEIRVERPDNSDALASAKTWEDLSLYAGQNMIAQAQNGSGKTATFALCMLAKTDRNKSNPQSICLCHTRELARQNMDVIRELDDRNAGAQIIVGTPGKLRELLMKRVIPTQDVKLFILDEADVMMDHASNMTAQVVQIRQAFPPNAQILLFSATFPERVKSFVASHVPRANRLQIQPKDLTLPTISQFFIECSNYSEKFNVLSDLYGCMTVGQSVIFVNTRKIAFDLAQRMKAEGHAVSLICGSDNTGVEKMDHATREKVMAEFRNGETKVLIATDVLARGIDVPQVTLVVNYDLPMRFKEYGMVDQEVYIHRIGRTGRFGLKGLSISLIEPRQSSLIKQIEDYYQCQISPLSKDPEQIEEMVHKLRH